jgi:hypothetical protein
MSKGGLIMERQRILNRIELLKSRKAENGNIIKKLERQLRKLGGEK